MDVERHARGHATDAKRCRLKVPIGIARFQLITDGRPRIVLQESVPESLNLVSKQIPRLVAHRAGEIRALHITTVTQQPQTKTVTTFVSTRFLPEQARTRSTPVASFAS